MPQGNQALKVAMAAVEQLPANLQRQLAEQVLQSVGTDDLLVVRFQRLSPAETKRLQELMDGNNDGLLTTSERLELERLSGKVDEMMLENSKRLARATRPELFDENGNPVEARLKAAAKSLSAKRNGEKRKAKSR
ncbi:MAG TPA: hypothetical protein PLD20_04675 [Blastocatellia bacterium]|nr:hypothetical protein [Blastocatellia bacterium]HMV81709.1 hypothetical protein [Blastocatellia bacterium]HMX24557.1 hypothetical protein [Blastocatellia bacterium]HMY74960.1 hypothetical protein [Blastocatellia bacterium]HMZ17202.1 hypothetical protein [Blastocatellia bacterium]